MTRAEVRLVPVTEANALAYKEIRLAMLLDSPRAFQTTHAQALAMSDEDWRARTHTSTTWLADVDGERAGAATLYPALDLPDGDAYLVAMWVDPAFRGCGVGDALVEGVADAARERGYRRLLLDVVTDNAQAISLYERCGFERTDEVQRRPDDPCIGELRMIRTL